MKEKEKLMYRVLLVDDEEMLLDSLEIILSLNDMEIMGKAHDGNECLKLLKDVSCDIALVDLNMKGMGGIELIGHLKKKYPGIRILVLTTFYDDGNITEAISNGADGYLLKAMPPAVLVQNVEDFFVKQKKMAQMRKRQLLHGHSVAPYDMDYTDVDGELEEL